MNRTRTKAWVFSVFLLSVSAGLRGGEPSCGVCGQSGNCKKVCRLVPEERTIEVICWGSEKEDFCIPGCSKPGCKHCKEVCGPEDTGTKEGDPCSKPRLLKWIEWRPSKSATIYTRKKLMKKVVVHKVPGFKWVVEELCDACEAKCEAEKVAAGEKAPPLPDVDAKVIR